MDNGFIIFDGAMGTQLQSRGLKLGELPELLCLTEPEIVQKIHEEFILSGAEVITANTFGANRKKLGSTKKVNEVVSAAVTIARKAGAKAVALDIGPTGSLLQPMGTMSFDEAYDIFKEVVIAGRNSGADLILIETMADLLEAKAALLSAKENSSLPVYVTMTFGEDGRTFLGTDPKVAAVTLSSLGADAVGINCSLGPDEMMNLVPDMLSYANCPVIVQPNAGLPEIENGRTVYRVGPEDFAVSMGKLMELGVSIVGGCCGTTPAHISALCRQARKHTKKELNISSITAFTSSQKAVILPEAHIAVIGERINPTGKKKIKESLRTRDYDYILNEAISQTEAGAEILDVNVGLPEIDEKEVLGHLITQIQGVTPLPLQIDSSSPEALERACRLYGGKPIINSVNGSEDSLRSILPIAKKYGACVVGLTLDENGIPEKAEDRVKIAEKILSFAKEYGIPKEDLLIDCLVLTASTNQSMVRQTLKAVRIVKEQLKVKTVLGVSNISFGLPSRDTINSAFLAEALSCGLDLPIINPLNSACMDVVFAHRVLSGEDIDSRKYIELYSKVKTDKKVSSGLKAQASDITNIVLYGKKFLIKDAVHDALKNEDPITVINTRLIPAINEAGDRFQKGVFFLPQLMSSAETVKLGFDVVKAGTKGSNINSKGKIILATVKGDIHDIGKNIVKMLLSNYGFQVIDLGRDVPPDVIVKETIAQNVHLVGLSALMTTTVKSMEETIKALRSSGAQCKVFVGGAVLSEEYAKLVGADYYTKDATDSAKLAEWFFSEERGNLS